MLRLAYLLAIVLALSSWSPSAIAAQEPEYPPEEEASEDGPFISLTFSPVHLLLPLFELTVEARVGEYCGIALLGGFGSATLDFEDEEEDISATLWNVGAQVVAYPLEPFESLQLGVELQYAHASVDGQLNGRRVSGIGSGLAVGPLVGYKLAIDVGFTFFVQGGVAFIAVKADAEDDTGETASTDEKRVLPNLNLNLGWSF
jgi:hypothetical protein